MFDRDAARARPVHELARAPAFEGHAAAAAEHWRAIAVRREAERGLCRAAERPQGPAGRDDALPAAQPRHHPPATAERRTELRAAEILEGGHEGREPLVVRRVSWGVKEPNEIRFEAGRRDSVTVALVRDQPLLTTSCRHPSKTKHVVPEKPDPAHRCGEYKRFTPIKRRITSPGVRPR